MKPTPRSRTGHDSRGHVAYFILLVQGLVWRWTHGPRQAKRAQCLDLRKTGRRCCFRRSCAYLVGRGRGHRHSTRKAGLRIQSPAEEGERVLGGTGPAPHSAGSGHMSSAGLFELRFCHPSKRPWPIHLLSWKMSRQMSQLSMVSAGLRGHLVPLALISFSEKWGESSHLKGMAHQLSVKPPPQKQQEADTQVRFCPTSPSSVPGPLLGLPGTVRAQPPTLLPYLMMSVLTDSHQAQPCPAGDRQGTGASSLRVKAVRSQWPPGHPGRAREAGTGAESDCM